MRTNNQHTTALIGCGLLIIGVCVLLFGLPQTRQSSTHSFLPNNAPMVVPDQPYFKAGEVTELTASDLLALPLVKNENEKWRPSPSSSSVKKSTSHLEVTTLPHTAPQTRQSMVRSIGGGASTTSNISVSSAHTNSTSKGTSVVAPMRIVINAREIHRIQHEPIISNDILLEDMQRIAPGDEGTNVEPGQGSGVTGAPIEDCPWGLLMAFVAFFLLRHHKRINKQITH